MARSEAEGILPINNAHFYPAKCSKSIKCRNYTLGVFRARGEAEGYKSHRGNNIYLILQQETHFDVPKRS